MKKKSVKKNYIYNLSYQILSLLIPLLTTPYLSRKLGAEGIGIYGYTLSIATYFVLFGVFGTNTYAQREIAYLQDKPEERNKVFKEILLFRIISFTITATLFFTLFCIKGDDVLYYRLLLFEIFGYAIDISWLFQGMEDFKRIVRKNVIVKIISLISIFVFIKTENDVWKYVFIYSFSNFIGFASLWINLKDYVSYNKLLKIQSLNIKRHIVGILLLFIPQVASTIYNVLDKTMLGIMMDDIKYVGYYEQAQKITRLSLTVITSLGTVMIPRISNLNSNGEKNKLKETIYKNFSFMFFLAFPISFGLIGISDNLVPWFFGEGFDEVSLLIKICSPIVIFIGIANVIGPQYLLSTKQQNKYTIAVIFSAMVNFIINLLLIPKLNAIGASIGSVIAELVGVLVELYFIRNDFSFINIIRRSFNYLLAGTIMLVSVLLLSNYLCSSMINTFVMILAGGVIYILVLLVINDRFLKNNINKIITFLKSRGEK